MNVVASLRTWPRVVTWLACCIAAAWGPPELFYGLMGVLLVLILFPHSPAPHENDRIVT